MRWPIFSGRSEVKGDKDGLPTPTNANATRSNKRRLGRIHINSTFWETLRSHFAGQGRAGKWGWMSSALGSRPHYYYKTSAKPRFMWRKNRPPTMKVPVAHAATIPNSPKDGGW